MIATTQAIPYGYKQSGAGVIPEEWNAASIDSVTPPNIKYGIVDGPFGSNLKTIHYRSSGVPIITSGYVTDGKFQAETYIYVDHAKFVEEKRSAVQPGDIVMAKIGERCGASAILPESHETGILSGNALKITVDETRHSTRYVWQVLWGLHVSGKMELLRTVGAQPALSMPNLKKYLIALPPTKDEQEAIAEALGDADAWIESLEQLVAKKRHLKQAAMQQLLTGKTRLPGFEGEWTRKRFGDIAEFFSGGTPSTAIAEFFNGDIPWITSSDLNRRYVEQVEGRISQAGFDNSAAKMVKANTLLMALYGATAGVTGITRISAAINQAVVAIVPDHDSAQFLFFKLAQLKEWLIETYTQGGQPNLSGEIVKSVMIPMPGFDEQITIAKVLFDMDAEIEAIEAKLAKARQIKQGMMQELLTGRTRLV